MHQTDKITIFPNKELEKAVAFSDRLQDAYSRNKMTVIAMRIAPMTNQLALAEVTLHIW